MEGAEGKEVMEGEAARSFYYRNMNWEAQRGGAGWGGARATGLS